MQVSRFDAVLVISFGGPQGVDDVRPFLANVLRGRPVPPARVEEVARHYELFGGVSPITDLTLQQAHALEQRLRSRGHALPVHVGMRNWHPFLADTLETMARAGVRRAVGFIAAPHRSFSSCEQYRQNVRDAQAEVARRGLAPSDVVYVGDWHTDPGFVEANADHVRAAAATLPDAMRAGARLVFTAHSIPERMAGAGRYQTQLVESARAVAARLAWTDWTLVYQSRSGRPQDPWLGPDVVDYLRAERGAGLEAVVISPVGFVCDHVEVLYDLDREAGAACREMGLVMARAESANLHPRFLDTMADAVTTTLARYGNGRPLPLVPGESRGEGRPTSRTAGPEAPGGGRPASG